MKRFIFLLVALMPVLVFAQKAKIDFTTTSHNFGTINENAGKATFDFSFKNTGNVPLILTNVRAGCGCTTPVWSREPVAPGQQAASKWLSIHATVRVLSLKALQSIPMLPIRSYR